MPTTILTPFAYALTVGTASVQLVPANPGRKGLMIYNPSNNTIAVCPAFTTANAALAAVVNGAGSINIVPGGLLVLPQPGATDAATPAAFNVIASGANSPVTVWEF